MSLQPRHTRRASLALGTTAIALLALTACGSSSTGASDTGNGGSAASAQTSGSAQGARGGAFQGRSPGTSGQIAAKQGSTLQVQNQVDGQVAVSYTGKTAITAQVAAALKDIKVGSCVTVTPERSSTGAASGSGTSSTLAAGQVRISDAVDGECTGGFGRAGFGGGGRPSGMPSGRPSGMPSGRPSNLPSSGPGGARGMMFANGKVTAVTGSGFTVENSFPGRGTAGGASGSAGSGASGASGSVTVTVSGSTTYTTTKRSDASALKVGKCVTAIGQADDTGAVAASQLTVSDPVGGACTSGFGGGFGGRGGQGGAPGDAAQGGAA